MKITVLVENTPKDASIRAEHGLSFYIEACGKKILLDAGQKSLFLENAALLGRDLAAVDFAVLSHGHGDHAGGLTAFREINPSAPIYMARSATRRCYVKKYGILFFNAGMDRAFVGAPGIVPLDGDKELAPGIHALVGFERKANYLTTSVNLYMRKGLGFKRDDFSHELALVIREGDTACIFSSCSHSGLHNIMGKISDVGLLAAKNLVFAGMHLYRAPGTQTESPAILDRFAADLLAFPDTTYFAGHCTGRIAFERLSATMGERLKPLRCGDVFEL